MDGENGTIPCPVHRQKDQFDRVHLRPRNLCRPSTLIQRATFEDEAVTFGLTPDPVEIHTRDVIYRSRRIPGLVSRHPPD
jgi:hypothetical protein